MSDNRDTREQHRIPEAFREQFRRHNREAIALTIITLVAAILLWTAFYVVVSACVLLVLSALKGGDARVPATFVAVFTGCALLLCLLAWIMRKLKPSFFPADHKSFFDNLMDIVLMLPRITFEVWGNFSAWQNPTERELRAAWNLMVRMGARGKIEMQRLPVEIPGRRLRERVVFLLQLAELAEVRRYHNGLWLVLRGPQARRLARSTMKIDPELPTEARLGAGSPFGQDFQDERI